MKKNDIILITVLLLLTCILPFAGLKVFGASGVGDTVLVYSNGELYGKYSLLDDRDIRVSTDAGFNDIRIAGGSVYVSDADCSGRDCVRCGHIHEQGDFITCIPHGLYILITSEFGGDVPDGVTY